MPRTNDATRYITTTIASIKFTRRSTFQASRVKLKKPPHAGRLSKPYRVSLAISRLWNSATAHSEHSAMYAIT